MILQRNLHFFCDIWQFCIFFAILRRNSHFFTKPLTKFEFFLLCLNEIKIPPPPHLTIFFTMFAFYNPLTKFAVFKHSFNEICDFFSQFFDEDFFFSNHSSKFIILFFRLQLLYKICDACRHDKHILPQGDMLIFNACKKKYETHFKIIQHKYSKAKIYLPNKTRFILTDSLTLRLSLKLGLKYFSKSLTKNTNS